MDRTSPALAGPSSPGDTLGVEEEYHVVDGATYDLLHDDALNAAALEGDLGARVQAEILTTQLEVATNVCRSISDVRSEIRAARREAAAAAATAGATILPASTHPFATLDEQRLTAKPRYIALYQRWGLLALQQDICGCHVHVSVPDIDTAVAVMDRARPYLPVLLAMTGSSPFHEGRDTRYDSYRTMWFARWPVTGPTEPVRDADGYARVVADLRAAGIIDDPTHLYWDVRPSTRYPTLEYRVGDVCTRVDDVVLHAVLCRALTRLLARRAVSGEAFVPWRTDLVRAARWRAARFGLADTLLDPATGGPAPAVDVLRRLLAELRDDLEEVGEWEEAAALTEQLLARGTSASAQRDRLLASGGDARAVAAWIVRDGVPEA